MLKLFGNSTRPVKLKSEIDSRGERMITTRKLGFQNQTTFTLSLSNISSIGGNVSCLDIILMRIYPVFFMEELNGKRFIRNEKDELEAVVEWEVYLLF